MFIRKVTIENFRSIKSASFEPKMICAIIGENNAGKSNLLAAINKILGPTYPTDRSFTLDDFYQRREDNRIYIGIDVVADDGSQHTIEYGYDDYQGNYRLKIDGRPANDTIRSQFPVVYLDVNRNVASHMTPSRWSLLGRLLLDMNREFMEDETRVDRFRQHMDAVKAELTTVGRFQQFVDILSAEAARQLNRRPTDLIVDFEMFDPSHFYKTIEFVVREQNIDFKAEQMGMGLQSSLVIALLRAYAEIKIGGGILIIEEPEVFFHPQAQRNFYSIIRELAENGTQVLYSTHSPLFLDVSHFDEICLVRKEEINGELTTTVTQVDVRRFLDDFFVRHSRAISEESFREHLRRAYNPRRSEGFFARKVVLVEGDTEEFSLPIYAQAMGYNLDREGVSVIGAGTKYELDRLYRIFNEFRIPTYVIFDGDKGKGDEHSARQTEEILRMLGYPAEAYPPTRVESDYAVFEVDFETTCRDEVPRYREIEEEVKRELGVKKGQGKGMVARWTAHRLCLAAKAETGNVAAYVPQTIKRIIEQIRQLEWARSVLKRPEGIHA